MHIFWARAGYAEPGGPAPTAAGVGVHEDMPGATAEDEVLYNVSSSAGLIAGAP